MSTLALEALFVQIRMLKQQILSIILFPNDVVHIYIGVFCVLIAYITIRRPRSAYFWLLPGFLISLGLEVPDLAYNYLRYQQCQWWESSKDVLCTSLVPFFWVWLSVQIPDKKKATAK